MVARLGGGGGRLGGKRGVWFCLFLFLKVGLGFGLGGLDLVLGL